MFSDSKSVLESLINYNSNNVAASSDGRKPLLFVVYLGMWESREMNWLIRQPNELLDVCKGPHSAYHTKTSFLRCELVTGDSPGKSAGMSLTLKDQLRCTLSGLSSSHIIYLV